MSYGSAAPGTTAYGAHSGGEVVSVTEAGTVSDSVQYNLIASLVEVLVGADTATSRGSFTLAAMEAAQAVDAVNVVFRYILTEQATAEDSATHRASRIVAAVEALVATGVAGSTMQAMSAVAEVLAAEAIATRGWQFAETESMTAADALVHTSAAMHAVVEQAVAADTGVATMRFILTVVDSAVAIDVASSKAAFFEALQEAMVATAAITIDNIDYVAWAINTANGGAASRYTHYGFNSFAAFEIGGQVRHFGCMDDGIYELAGGTDDGDAIKAVVRGGMTNFGNAMVKRMPMGYVALTASGELVMKVIVTSEAGGKETHWYKLEGRTAGATREDRFKPDGGLASVWWQWELINLDGADFAIHEMAFVPLAMTRRV